MVEKCEASIIPETPFDHAVKYTDNLTWNKYECKCKCKYKRNEKPFAFAFGLQLNGKSSNIKEIVFK